MCGIAGLIRRHQQPVSETELKQMTDAIIHRGPDGEGHWIDRNIGIGHRRLSIIDLSDKAAQPMISQTGRYVLSYNGEVYNFRELRDELQKKGHHFVSDTDSEVVLNALIEWGPLALNKFNGMFAFAFYDIHEKQLMLARDRYGIKPLYIAQQNGLFAFASEQKAITALSDFKKTLDIEAVYEYFTFQNILTDKTFLKDVKMFPAGCYAQLSCGDDEADLTVTRYWDYHFKEKHSSLSVQDYQEELRRLFKQAVKRQLVSDVEVGSYLSGGIDSGSITAIASGALPNLKTFTCGFDMSGVSGFELGFDERATSESMATYFGTEHYEIVLKSGDMARCLPELSWHIEEPRVGQSYPNYYVSRLASKFVKVVLSGAGGDELFGGYPWRYYRATNSQNFEDYIENYFGFWQRLLTADERQRLFVPVWDEVKHIDPKAIFRDVFSKHENELNKAEDYINHSLYFEAKTFLHGLFVIEDKLSMAHSLETRLPFMDNDLVDFAMSCPVNLKLNNLAQVVKLDENERGRKSERYFSKTNDGKQILRDSMATELPPNVKDAIKQGFSAPDATWFKSQSHDLIADNLFDPQNGLDDIIDPKVSRALLDEHIGGQKNRRLLIWSLLNFKFIMQQMRA